jgi:N-acetylneuraminic acid mutarotase
MGFNKNPIICGGFQNNTSSRQCYSLENNAWVPSASMTSVRGYAAAAQLPDGTLLATGGLLAFGTYFNSAELLTKQGWKSNIPSLPVTIYSHCMVTVNSTTVMVIGGAQNKLISGRTFYFTLGAISWTEGPTLKYSRDYFSCGKIRSNKVGQEMSIIVAGGWNGSSALSSVEMLAEGSNLWQIGPELPFGIWRPQMIEDQNGGVVFIGGQSSSGVYLDTLYQLPNGGQGAVWTKMNQKMKIGRWMHIAIMVPDSSVNCS